ncbi:uncharacterized protein LOC126835258 [Adelges cooleyi]|uniref:uncharacterized protein LOC126835258 n=1 Tax=Adelges cooleyi TaxID=133065 RepID=UPI00217F6F30|nr:uncharacterized protein LOC126835258 [Adelges cooleyi]
MNCIRIRSFAKVNLKYESTAGLFTKLIFHKTTLVVPAKEELLNNSIKNYHYDAFDAFTNALVQEKTNKWRYNTFAEHNKIAKIKSNTISKTYHDIDYLITYLQQSLKRSHRINKLLLGKFMITVSKHGRIDGLNIIDQLCDLYEYRVTESKLKMYYAEAYWVNGNLKKMFEILEWFYPIHSTKVLHIIDPIICNIVKSQGEASVVMALNFVNTIMNKYSDFYPISVLWKYLFTSELYNDNIEAERLVQTNSQLIDQIQYMVPTITRDLIKINKIEHIYKLMTLMLKYNRMESYKWILRHLFNYYYIMQNVRQCKEIMKHSIELNIPLTNIQQSQLINMVFKNKQPKQINKDVTTTIFKLMF